VIPRLWRGVLNELLGLDIVHAVDTGDTVTVVSVSFTVCFSRLLHSAAVAYPTESTRPVSARLFSSCTPRILCSRMEETSVGVAFASAA
jgi:hypothetical protein